MNQNKTPPQEQLREADHVDDLANRARVLATAAEVLRLREKCTGCGGYGHSLSRCTWPWGSGLIKSRDILS